MSVTLEIVVSFYSFATVTSSLSVANKVRHNMKLFFCFGNLIIFDKMMEPPSKSSPILGRLALKWSVFAGQWTDGADFCSSIFLAPAGDIKIRL